MIPTLALDTATKTGYCYADGQSLRSGVWMLSGSGSEHAGKPFQRLREFILDAHRAWRFRRLVFEASAYGGDFLAVKQFHNAARGVMLLVACELDLTWAEYVPATIKAFAGNGRFKKHDMIHALHRHYPDLANITSHDIADAVWLLKLDQHRQANPLAQLQEKKPKGRRRKQQAKLFR